MSGTLHVVAVPIGHPDDITIRALRALREATVVAAEDTRSAAALLSHHGITASIQSFHDHNENQRLPGLLRQLASGARVALVSEAGTPLVNDPGYRLVRAAIEAGIVIDVVPGACAAVAALCGAGLPTDRWLYAGFVPRGTGDRDRLADEIGGLDLTVVFYESPQRLAGTLDWVAETWPGRRVCVARNLTKKHEQWLRGTASEVRAELGDEVRGEVVLLLAPPGRGPLAADADVLVRQLLERGQDPRGVRDAVAEATGLSKREAYRKVLEALGRAGAPDRPVTTEDDPTRRGPSHK